MSNSNNGGMLEKWKVACARSSWCMVSTVKMASTMVSGCRMLGFHGRHACRAMNEAWRGSQRMLFRTGGAAGKAGHACGCGKAHLLHRGVGEPALPFMGW